MNISLKFLATLFFLTAELPCSAQNRIPPAHVPIVPAKPEVILPCLPPAPENWKLTESQGFNVFSNWQSTIATRSYLEIPPPPQPGMPPKVPGTTKITVTDTGYDPGLNAIFSVPIPNSNTGSEQADNSEERGELNGYPMIRTIPAKEGDDGRIKLWIKQRFIVLVVTSNQDKDADKKWAQMVDGKSLAQITDDVPTRLSDPLLMSVFDELQPIQTRTYKMFWHDPNTRTTR